MDTSTGGYLAFVVLGIGLVVGVGSTLTRGGRTYLREVFPDQRAADSVSRLLTVMFYLFALGILGVISTMSVPVDGVAQTVVTKLGVVLLILGLVFGATMLVLSRIRAQREESEKGDILLANMPQREVHEYETERAEPLHTVPAESTRTVRDERDEPVERSAAGRPIVVDARVTPPTSGA